MRLLLAQDDVQSPAPFGMFLLVIKVLRQLGAPSFQQGVV